MNLWYYFWILNFVVAGATFTVITLIVAVRGFHDLLLMFERLNRAQQGHTREFHS
jgi:hypothetical protein